MIISDHQYIIHIFKLWWIYNNSFKGIESLSGSFKRIIKLYHLWFVPFNHTVGTSRFGIDSYFFITFCHFDFKLSFQNRKRSANEDPLVILMCDDESGGNLDYAIRQSVLEKESEYFKSWFSPQWKRLPLVTSVYTRTNYWYKQGS